MRIVSKVLASAALALTMSPLAAQSSGGREIVQPLPPKAAEELRTALAQLARTPRNLNALIAAGTASLELDDVDAAIGFFGRAFDLAPEDPRIKAGKAAAFARTRRPVEAVRLFEEAEAGGVEIIRLAGDFGLAYDLVGNNKAAQARYRRALASQPNDEVTRRLALSQAIDGDDRGFEQTLRPLLAKRDFAAYRTRAFGLAILGRGDDAVAITEAVMPPAMAEQIEGYLRFMPRLTKAQQAAAGNLGVFPTAARIGRDDPRIAALSDAAPTRVARTADAGLAPSGAPLGAASQDAPRNAAAQDDDEDVVAVASRQEAERTVRVARREAASDPLSRTRQRPRIVRESAATESAPQDTTPNTPEKEEPASPVRVAELAPSQSEAATPIAQPEPAGAEPVVVATLDGANAAPGFDLANTSESAPATATDPAPEDQSLPASETASVSDAFADLLGSAVGATTPAAGAVDITAIEAPRELPPEPEPEPAEPEHPSRFWVQVATGRDRSALRFDWRRLSRAADGLLDDKGPFVTTWGQTNRLLAGPYPTRRAARNALNSLMEKDIDAFTFTSPEGQVIDELR